MRGLLIRFSVTCAAVLVATQVVDGLSFESAAAGVAAVVVLSLLNAIVRPLLYLVSLPFILLTLGLFMVVINALLLQLTALLVKGFVVEGFWPAFWGALIISLVSTILNLWVSEEGRVEIVVRRPRQPKIIN